MSFAVSPVVNDCLATINEDTISKISDTVTDNLMKQIKESFNQDEDSESRKEDNNNNDATNN